MVKQLGHSNSDLHSKLFDFILKKSEDKIPITISFIADINIKNKKDLTRIELRYYKFSQFLKLPKEQRGKLGK